MGQTRLNENSYVEAIAGRPVVTLCLAQLPAGLDRCALRAAGRRWLVQRLSVLTGRHVLVTDLEYSANGRPEIDGLGWGFSYANCGRFAVLAAMPGRRCLGVDLERVTDRSSWFALARRYFAADEIEALRAVIDPVRRRQVFYALWTAKEARVKCAGGRLWPMLADSIMPSVAGQTTGEFPRWWWQADNNLMLCLWGDVAGKPVQWNYSVGGDWRAWRWAQ